MVNIHDDEGLLSLNLLFVVLRSFIMSNLPDNDESRIIARILNSTDSYRTNDDQIESMPQSSSDVVIVDLFTILVMTLDPYIPQLYP